MLRRILLALLVLPVSSFSCAKEYGHHDPKRMLTVSETPSGKQHGLDLRYLDQMLNDLALHARNTRRNSIPRRIGNARFRM